MTPGVIAFLTFSREQVRENRMVPPLHIRHLHCPRTSGVDHQVRGVSCCSAIVGTCPECSYRIYAVTMKNVPIAIGLGLITASQFALGLWLSIIAAREGGKLVPSK